MTKLFSKPKALLSIALVLCMVICMLPLGIFAFGAGATAEPDVWDGGKSEALTGNGTTDDPYLITSGGDLAFMAEKVNAGEEPFVTGVYSLENDINLGGEDAGHSWTPIGYYEKNNNEKPFKGVFKGNDKTVSGLYYNKTDATDYDIGVGFFGMLDGATVENLHVEGSIVTNRRFVGGIAGRTANTTTLTNCTFSGVVEAGAYDYSAHCGGLVGYASGALTVTDCFTAGTVTGSATVNDGLGNPGKNPENVGGLIGYIAVQTTATVTNSGSTSTVSGGIGTGGLIGTAYSNDGTKVTTVTIVGCWFKGELKSTSANAGGLVGQSRFPSNNSEAVVNLSISDSFSAADMTSCSHSNTAGIFGGVDSRNNSNLGATNITLSNCFFAGVKAKAGIANGGTYGSVINVFYKADSCVADQSAYSNPTGAESKTADEMASAAFVATLNGERAGEEAVWMVGTAGYPVLKQDDPSLQTLTVGGASVDLKKYPESYAQTVTSSEVTVVATPAGHLATLSVSAVNGTGAALKIGANGEVAVSQGQTTVVTFSVTYKALTKNYVVNLYKKPDVWDGESYEYFAGGSGTQADPYQIANAAQLYFLALTSPTKGKTGVAVTIDGQEYEYNRYENAYFMLLADIDLGGHAWRPIGEGTGTTYTNTLSGLHFYGNDHTISNLTIVQPTARAYGDALGFFGNGINLEVKDLHLVNGTIEDKTTTTTTHYLSGFLGLGCGTFTNCSFSGNIESTQTSANAHVGGILGYNIGGNTTLTNCRTSGSISTKSTTGRKGGLIGYQSTNNVTVTGCYSTMNNQGGNKTHLSGLVGAVSSGTKTLTISNSYFAGQVGSPYPIALRQDSASTVTATNVYYLDNSFDGTEAKGDGIGANSKKTADDFADGTVAGLLGAGWVTVDGLPVHGTAAPVYGIDGDLEFDSAVKEYTAQTTNKYTLNIQNIADGTKIVVSADKEEALTATGNTYTVTPGAGKTVVVTILVSFNGMTKTYTATITDTRWDGESWEPFVGYGDSSYGGSGKPYEIANAKQLAFLMKTAPTYGQTNGNVALTAADGTTYNYDQYQNKWFKLTADIDLCGQAWRPIGTSASGAALGNFNFKGEGYTISNWTIAETSSDDNIGDSIGFFGKATKLVVENLHLVNGTITDTYNNDAAQYLGGFLGRGIGTFTNCSFSGTLTSTVTGQNYTTGGIVGSLNTPGALTDCWTSGSMDIAGGAQKGGLIGFANCTLQMTGCYSIMNITAKGDTAGLIGSMATGNAVTISNSYFAGTVTSSYPITARPESAMTVTPTVTNVYYLDTSFTGMATGIGSSADNKKTAGEFANGTVTGWLGEGWATSTAGYPVHSDFVELNDSLEELGTSIRTTGTKGIRFHFAIDKNKVDNKNAEYNIKEYGIVIGKGQNFSEVSLYRGAAKTVTAVAFDGENSIHAREDAANYYFTALLTFNANTTNLLTAYNARAYVVYTDSNDQEFIVYSTVIDGVDENDEGHPNTLYDVAVKALENQENMDEPFSESELNYLNDIKAKGDALKAPAEG